MTFHLPYIVFTVSLHVTYVGHSTEKGNFVSGGLGVRYLGFVGICEHTYPCQ